MELGYQLLNAEDKEKRGPGCLDNGSESELELESESEVGKELNEGELEEVMKDAMGKLEELRCSKKGSKDTEGAGAMKENRGAEVAEDKGEEKDAE